MTVKIELEFTTQEYADLVDGHTQCEPEVTLKEYTKDCVLRMNQDNILMLNFFEEES